MEAVLELVDKFRYSRRRSIFHARGSLLSTRTVTCPGRYIACMPIYIVHEDRIRIRILSRIGLKASDRV
jgi:hypothetical protein